MPALFAYLVAVGLLLGGGYGALSWLAAPEPVKMAARAKPAPHREAKPETTSRAAEDSGTSSVSSSGSAEAAENSNEVPPSPPAETTAAAPEQSAKTEETSGAALTQQEQAHQDRAANAEAPQADVKQSAEAAPPVQAVLAPSPGNQQTAAATVPATAAKTVRRPHQRQAGGRLKKPAPLALMTLRTIEYPDGRRVTQLIPYRSPDRALAFGPDD
ncbi:MAG: hypothetical protein JWP25_8638 [Bradyrhizobium sp.]|jgi:hypothetical protein|nr:hypothetical protein [Bradyrhizobium sp.]MEA2869583.1 hypothetical protein [Bradyrhizobium sp.]